MRIAVSVNDQVISDHFGLCENYMVLDVEDGKIVGEELHKNPGHAPGVTPPSFVAGLHVAAALGGTVAQGAVDVMKNAGVDVVLGASGDPRQAALDYASGKLKHDPEFIKSCGGC
ncbi:Dinitrogenase iron-molybdenum cofactor [anaerobic digester metagenome]